MTGLTARVYFQINRPTHWCNAVELRFEIVDRASKLYEQEFIGRNQVRVFANEEAMLEEKLHPYMPRRQFPYIWIIWMNIIFYESNCDMAEIAKLESAYNLILIYTFQA